MSDGTRILLVDDESGILDTLRILLRGDGYDVVAALSGREAIEILPDATFVTTTYGHWTAGEPPYIVSVRFKLDDLDEWARRKAESE